MSEHRFREPDLFDVAMRLDEGHRHLLVWCVLNLLIGVLVFWYVNVRVERIQEMLRDGQCIEVPTITPAP